MFICNNDNDFDTNNDDNDDINIKNDDNHYDDNDDDTAEDGDDTESRTYLSRTSPQLFHHIPVRISIKLL